MAYNFRFGTLELVRSDWRKYKPPDDEMDNDTTDFSVGIIGIQENEESYVSLQVLKENNLIITIRL